MSNPNPVHTKEGGFENPKVQAKALASRKSEKSKNKRAATQAITKSPAITQGRTKRVTPEIQEKIREKLLGTEKNGHSYITNFIDNFLKEAKEDPNSQAARMLAQSMFNSELLSSLDEQLNKQMAKDNEFLLYRIRNTLYDKQAEVFDNNVDQTIIMICTRRAGKCWAPGTKIRLFNGDVKKVEDIKVGDVLMGYDNTPRKVLSTTRGKDLMYKVHSSRDDISFVCNSAHILTVWDRNTNTLVDKPLSYFLKHPAAATGYSGHYRLLRAKIDYPEKEHKIDPYILGLWLGDGCKSDAQITIGKDEKELIEFAQNSGWNEHISKNAAPSWWVPGMKVYLRQLNLLSNKHIPQEYKIDSIENRLKLLAGLIDSDGWHESPGSINISLSDKVLFDDVLELIQSLGFHTIVRGPIPTSYKKDGARIRCKDAYSVTFKGDLDLIPNKVSRKQGIKSKQNLGYGFIIDALPEGDYYGFTVEGDGRVLLADYTINHNTELNARLLLKDCTKPNHHALYLNRSFDNAVRQLGKPLDDLLMKLDMPHTGQVSSGFVQFDNGSDITLSGYNNKGDIDRYRGGKYSLIILDEISHLRSPKVLIEEVLEPSQIDFGKEAQMIFTGTPPRNKVNYARDLWNNPKIKHYHWSFMNNPYIPDKEDVIEKICEKHGVSIDSAFIQREYFGNMDAIDEDSMIFRGYRTYNELPKNISFEKAYVGVDFGFEDAAAVISGVVYNKTLYIVDQWSEKHQPISTLCEEVKRQYDNLKKMPLKQEPWVITDTNVKEGAYELQATYKIPNVFCAYKYDKDVAIEQLAEFMRTDKILIPNNPNGILYIEAENTLWKRDDETDEITHEIDDDALHPNALMALLYVSRQFAYEVLNIIDVNKPAKEITNAQEFVHQYETFEDDRTPNGLLELGDAETARHFVR